MVHCDIWISKAPPVQFIDDFLSVHFPSKAKKFGLLDHGGELHGSPQIKKHNHTVLPTAPDASNQKPVERHHQTVANAVQAAVIGANLPIKFWPHCLLHTVQMFNSPPSWGQETASPIEMTTNKKEDCTPPLRTF